MNKGLYSPKPYFTAPRRIVAEMCIITTETPSSVVISTKIELIFTLNALSSALFVYTFFIMVGITKVLGLPTKVLLETTDFFYTIHISTLGTDQLIVRARERGPAS